MLTPEYDPGLVEAAVLAAARGHPAAVTFTRERDPLYEIEAPDARETAFAEHHARWFEAFGLDRPLMTALSETPAVERGCARCVVARAPDLRDECTELMVPGGGAGAVALVAIAPETLAVPARALPLLRRELLHVADMLDPAFGYAPRLGEALTGPLERVARARYRVLWNTYVDGRLERAGRAQPGVRRARQREFLGAFPELAGGASTAFERLWTAEACTHADLATLAAGTSSGTRRSRCSLCSLPPVVGGAPDLPPDLRAAIAADFPGWDPTATVCARCAEVYAARIAT